MGWSAMSNPTAPPWEPGFTGVSLAVLGLGAFIALASLANGDASGVLAFLAGAVTLGVMALGRGAVSRFRGDGDE